MSKPRPAKSGSRVQRPAKQAPKPNQPAVSLSAEARKALDHALAVSNQFPGGSSLAIQTLTRCCVELIRTHGSRICSAVLKEVRLEQDPSSILLTSIFQALSETGEVQEAKRLMREIRMLEIARAEVYHHMAKSAEIKEWALQELKQLFRQTSSNEIRLYIEYALFFHSDNRQVGHLTQNLIHFVERCREKRGSLTLFEVDLLLDIAILCPSCEMYKHLYQGIERIKDPALKKHGEEQLLSASQRLAKDYLLELADALSGSSYEPRLREFAAAARTLSEQDALVHDDS